MNLEDLKKTYELMKHSPIPERILREDRRLSDGAVIINTDENKSYINVWNIYPFMFAFSKTFDEALDHCLEHCNRIIKERIEKISA